ncbi:hypothetical protein WICANDRAFT_84752 [Wickerhamomyces anomalus NRRL Y-366-8]|uniref:DUF962-domain-containing protein n=1 Tax=Wickerhamomyces anomalus (strain ATCC 58044 / CBS 1984 / NCYC 433 / NRRL Y-366-8) TaxID=683960 RepID=A0A1E3P0X7_WICAA|nr:uncharacterized protein WICANDRAFT_84752 [Wickerhamomyces anomalus NRRL Y-366-8]ODQ59101.1 hypothetical protein WICANDRAFT_84752 [Wickerhamomyces anomalus NRRL Y-366-8]
MAINLEDQLVFYRSYHFNTINVLIHSVFVPTIMFSSFGYATNVRIPIPIPHLAKYLNLGVLGSLGYSLFYLYLDFIGGALATPILMISSIYFTDLTLYSPEVNKLLIAAFVIGWLVQFIGHGVFEKRAPALLDNLLQALVLAPFFILFELFFLLGFRTDLKKRVDARVEVNIANFRAKKK